MSDSAAYVRSQTIEAVEKATKETWSPKDLVTVKSTDTVEAVLKVLSENSIISAPIVDAKLKSGEVTSNGTPFLGIINVGDLLTAFAFQPVFNTYDTDAKLSELKEGTLKTVTEAQQKVLKTPVADVLGLSSESKTLWKFDEKDTLDKLFDAFSVGVHRVLVSHISSESKYWTFVSQSDVLRYLRVQSYRRKSKVGGVFLNRLSALKLGQTEQKFTAVSAEASAITGFRTMLGRNELSALPVVDEKGKLVETLSASDFRNISLENLKDTLLPVSGFLKSQRGRGHTLATVEANEFLSTAVDKLLLGHVHRLWVVDGEGKPVGAVSLTDIIKAFSTYASLT